MASRAVDRVEKLVVLSCNAYVTERDVSCYNTTRDVRAWPPVQREFNVGFYGEKYFSETWAAWVDSCRTTLEENNGDICRGDLSKIKAPTLILHGARDALIPVEHGIYLNESIERST